MNTLSFQNKAQNLFVSETFANNNGVWLVAALSGIFGIALGLAHSTWHDMATGSQIVSGIVPYAKENPFRMLIVRAWSISNQIGALALLGGISEKTLSFIVSAGMGALYFQALSLLVFALSGNILVSILIPFSMQFAELSYFGINYMIQFLGFFYAYGSVGLGFVFLVIALFSARQYKAGGMFLGIAPAFHAMQGALLGATLLAVLLWDFKRLRQHLMPTLKYFMVGCLVTGASLLFHKLAIDDVPKIDADIARDYVNAVIRYWDPHRRPVNLLSLNFYLAVLCSATSFSLLKFCRGGLPDHFHFPLRVFTVTGIIGIASCLMTHIPPDMIDPLLVRFMPARFLNVNVLGLIPLLIGILAFYKDDFLLQLNLFLLVLVLFLVLAFHPPYWGRMMVSMLTLSAIVLVFRISVFSGSSWLRFKSELPGTGAAAILAIVVAFAGIQACSSWKDYKGMFQYWENDRMFSRIHEGKGSLLLADSNLVYQMQLYTQHPVLLGSFSTEIAYVPEGGPASDRILKEVYGVDLFNPSPETKRTRSFPMKELQELWESRTPEQWKKIKEKYSVGDVFVNADWKLQLPVSHPPEWITLYAAGGGLDIRNKKQYILYSIP